MKFILSFIIPFFLLITYMAVKDFNIIVKLGTY